LPYAALRRVSTARKAAPGNPAAAPSQQHTGAAVPIYGVGPNSRKILGTTHHTDLFDIMLGR